MPPREPDAQAIGQFVSAMFRYADEGTFVSLRAFQERENRPVFINGAPVGPDLHPLAEIAARSARRAANHAEPAVFCPPIATFNNPNHAREEDLVNGLALSVECDATPNAARAKLEAILGPATVVVLSGGEWMDPDTGEVQDKLHLHWRLTEPTREAADHARLKWGRKLAQVVVGGDHSNVPTVHPIRWPGSWHRKKSPRLAQIVALQDHVELDLDETIVKLREALAAAGIDEATLERENRAKGSGAAGPGRASAGRQAAREGAGRGC